MCPFWAVPGLSVCGILWAVTAVLCSSPLTAEEAARLLSMFSQKTAASTRALPAQPSGLKNSSQNSQTQMVLRMGSR